MATFFSGLVIGFANCWQIALITLATSPFIVAAEGISNIFLHRLVENIQDAYAEAASIAEQVIFVKTGLGDRIATYFVKCMGKSTLGLSYGLTLSEALIAPAMPSTIASSSHNSKGGGTELGHGVSPYSNPVSSVLTPFFSPSPLACQVSSLAAYSRRENLLKKENPADKLSRQKKKKMKMAGLGFMQFLRAFFTGGKTVA